MYMPRVIAEDCSVEASRTPEAPRSSPGGIGNNLDMQFARARPVEFGVKNGLPAAEQKAALFAPYALGRADEQGLDVRIGIPLCMLVVSRLWYQSIERSFDVARHMGIVPFVDEHTSGRVRDVKMAHSIGAPGIDDGRLNFDGELLELGSTRRADLERAPERMARSRCHVGRPPIEWPAETQRNGANQQARRPCRKN